MKKIIALALALMMVFCFAACGSKPTATIKVIDGVNDAVLYEFETEITEGKTAGEMLEEYLAENGVDYTIYDGDMIGSIGDLEQDAENWSVYWAIYFNGEYGSVGLWGYEPAEGDVIEIKYEESNW